MAVSKGPNDTISMDFVSDALANGRRIKCLTVVDDFTRECVDIAVDHGIGGKYVVRLLDQVACSAATRAPCAPTMARSPPVASSSPDAAARH